MQPWRISVGLTAAACGSAALLFAPRLDYLRPFWREILAEHAVEIGLNAALALWALAAGLYAVARTTGLADLGSRVDLAERSVRRGEGDPELARALKSDAEGEWDSRA